MKVVLVDDHDVVREGLKSAVERSGFEVVAQARTVKEALAQIAHTNPDAVLIDLHLPDGNGLEIVTWVRSISKTVGIVILTMNDDDEYLLSAMKAGANAFINKSAPLGDVLSAVALSVQAPSHFTAAGLREAISRNRERYGLTARELEVLALLPDGSTAKEIGTRLFLSEPTIKTHMASIYRKLEVKNRTAAITRARTSGLLK